MNQVELTTRASRLRNLAVVLILLFGFELRITDVGSAPLQGDEAWLSYLAYDFGHNGQRSALGVTSSAGVNQPPFFADVFAIPFSFSPDPRLARIFMAALQLVGMSALYFMVRRYWTQRTAFGALVLFSVMPRAVWAGRFLWNPYLAVPFIIGFLATGFLLAEGKRWARWLHFPLLACAVGAHPIMVILGLLTPGFFLRDWLNTCLRRRLLVDYGIGTMLALVVLGPWAIGIIQQRVNTPDQGVFQERKRTSLATILQFVVQAPVYVDVGPMVMPPQDYVEPTGAGAVVYLAIGSFSLLASLFLVARALIQLRQQNGRYIQRPYADLMIGLAYFVMPVVLLFSPTRTYDQYFITLVPTTAVVQAIVLVGGRVDNIGHARSRGRLPPLIQRRTIALGIGTFICAAELALVFNAMHQIRDLRQFEPGAIPSLAALIQLRDAAVTPGKETIYLVDSGSTVAFEQELVWLILANKGPSRVIWGNNFAYPLPANGATYVGYADSQNIPELYSMPKPRLIADDMYRVVDVPPNTSFVPTCQPEGATRLSNGATILGYYVPVSGTSQALLHPVLPWTIYVLWKSVVNTEHVKYQIFNHLVDAQGNKYAQSDQPTLDTDLWHDGDLMINKITLTPTDKLPLDKPLFLQAGMYTLPHGTNQNLTNAEAVDSTGESVGNWITIPICTSVARYF